ncbi:MAG: hypothetical protein AAF533_06235 [Acidobacteriota bacterium]
MSSTPNLIVGTTSGNDLGKNFDGTVTVWWSGVIGETNWADANVLSTDDSARIKVKWQKRMNDYDNDGSSVPAIRMGVTNDSGKKVEYQVEIIADQGSDASARSTSDGPSAVASE